MILKNINKSKRLWQKDIKSLRTQSYSLKGKMNLWIGKQQFDTNGVRSKNSLPTILNALRKISSFNFTFYYSKCSEYKKDVKNVQAEIDGLRNSMRAKENEWRLEKSVLEVYKLHRALLILSQCYLKRQYYFFGS